MEQTSLFKIRDRRRKGWFFMDNEYLNGYAKKFGPVGTAIYVSLCRHANNETQECFPSQELIASELGITSRAVRNHIKRFEKANIIKVIRDVDPRTKKRINNTYLLIDKDEWKKPEELASYGKKSSSQRNIKTKARGTHVPIKETPIKDTNKLAKANGKDLKELISYFFELKGWDNKGKDFYKENKIVYARFTRPAKDLLKQAKSLEIAKDALDYIKDWAEERKLDWMIETAIRKYLEFSPLTEDIEEPDYIKTGKEKYAKTKIKS